MGLLAGVIREIESASHFIIDLDGTILFGKELAPGARELIERVKGRFVILSNNSTDTAASLSHLLCKLGLMVEPDQLILAGEHTVRFIAERYPGARIMLIGSPLIRRMARRKRLMLVQDKADFVVLSRDRRFNYDTMALAVNELRRGAKLVVTNTDLSHPTRNGGVVPETGTLMRALTACADVAPAHIIGKPEKTLFVEALRRLNAQASQTLVIGDNPATDAMGAQKLGMRFLLVSEGLTRAVPKTASVRPRSVARA